MLQTSVVIYCAVDRLVPVRGRIQRGFEEFSAALEHAAIPFVWVSTRSRLQLDYPRRNVAHNHPFLAEGGCGVYLPEGYFHLPLAKSLRFGRFTCIPVAEPQPAASEAVEELSKETHVPVVSLASLSPRELAHNLGLANREAELARHRDFDEPFFFAGGSPDGITQFTKTARGRKLELRQDGALWSLAVGASVKQCVRELSKLYERALHARPLAVGIATKEEGEELFAACDRNILLVDDSAKEPSAARHGRVLREISLTGPDAWEQILESVTQRR